LFFTSATRARRISDMAKPNYQFEKRKRDMDKKAKKKEKAQRKIEKANAPAEGDASETPTEGEKPAE
jgi:hypothetical protein